MADVDLSKYGLQKDADPSQYGLTVQNNSLPSEQDSEPTNPFVLKPTNQSMFDLEPELKDPKAVLNALPGTLESAFMLSQPEFMIENMAKPLFNSGLAIGKNALDYIRPAKSMNAMMDELGGGAATAQENTANIARRVNLASNSNRADALASKQNVLDQVGNKDMFEVPAEGLPENNLDHISNLFNDEKKSITEDQIGALSKALKKYRKDGNINNFIDSGEDIFDSSEGISAKDSDLLSDMLSLPSTYPSQYLNATKDYNFENKSLQNLHDKFEESPTFSNADQLQSQLGSQIGRLGYKAARKDLDTNGYNELDSLKSLRDKINADQKTFLQNYDPRLDQEYDLFRQKWRENVVPYDSNDTLINMSKGQTTGHSINDVASVFKNDEPNAMKVRQDIGPAGQNAILYNELQRVQPGDVNGFLNALRESKRVNGYQSYVTPEMEASAKGIKNQLLARNVVDKGGLFAGSLAGGTALGGLFGHPFGGALAGVFANPLLNKLLAKLDEVPK